MEKYKQLEQIGRGTYGVVWKGKDLETNETVAMKYIEFGANEEGVPGTVIREISLLKEMHHPNIINLYHVLHADRKLILIFEYLDWDLRKYLDARKDMLPVHVIKSFLCQLLRAVKYIHERRILHRDLKPSNLLIDSKGQLLKLADFGLARCSGIPVRSYSTDVVTLWYRAPDVLLGSRNYDTSIDMWSVGCIFAELFLGAPLFPGRNAFEQLTSIFQTLGSPRGAVLDKYRVLPSYKEGSIPYYAGKSLEECVPGIRVAGSKALDLLGRLLEFDPERRISAEDALNHPFLADVSVPTDESDLMRD